MLFTNNDQPPKSPRASPIVIIVKENGVDITLCIDYRLVIDLNQLMIYFLHLIHELLNNLERALWYGFLEMASGFWFVGFTEKARRFLAFATPLEIVE